MTQIIEQPQQLARREAPQTAVTTRRYEPLAPIGNVETLRGLLETPRVKEGIAAMLPRHITPERVLKTMLVAVNRNPDILKCTQSSVLETINRAAELGLDLSGTLGEAYPVPFNNSVKDSNGNWNKIKQLSLIIGYRGMEKLAWQSGEVESIDAEVVCIKDHFKFRKGTEVTVEWSPALDGDRGAIIGAYACVKLKSGGKLARFLPVSELEKIRNASQSKDSPAWKNWKEEMYRKCTLKRTLKDAPLSTEKYVKAMEIEEADYEMRDVVEAEVGTARGTAALTEKLKARNGTAAPAIEPHDGDPQPEPGALPDGSGAPVSGEVVNKQTGEVKDADESQIGGEDEHQQPEAPEIDSQTAPKELPSPCTQDQIRNLLLLEAPEGMDGKTASDLVTAYLNVKLSKKWDRLKRDEQLAYFKTWTMEGFPPFKAT